MSDPRVDLLAKHIASVLVTLIDIARDGAAPAPVAAEPVVEAQVQEEPAKRKGRPPKADAARAAADSSADDPATPVSDATTAAEAGTPPTGSDTTGHASDDTLLVAQDLTIKLVQAKGRDAAVGALSDFNVAKASALAADQIGAYCEAVRELLSA